MTYKAEKVVSVTWVVRRPMGIDEVFATEADASERARVLNLPSHDWGFIGEGNLRGGYDYECSRCGAQVNEGHILQPEGCESKRGGK